MVERVYIANASGFVADVDISGRLSVNASVVATANISGQTVVLGSGSFAPMSGLFVNISGQGVTASVTTNISGQTVYLTSGFNSVREVGSSIINSILSGAYIITGNSGGNILFSGGPNISVILRSASGNNPMYIGAPNATSNGVGMPIYANESMTLNISNFNAIGAFAITSGQILNYIGLA